MIKKFTQQNFHRLCDEVAGLDDDLAGIIHVHLPDEAVRARLIALKGIGNWTIDVYLMFVLQRADIFPLGDLAAVNALRRVKSCRGILQRSISCRLLSGGGPTGRSRRCCSGICICPRR